MATFFDDFERANGSLGSNWTATANAAISGGYVTSSAFSVEYAYANTLSDNGKHVATATMGYVAANSLAAGPIVKMTGATATGYAANLRLDGSTYKLGIRIAGLTGTILAEGSIGTTQPFSWAITLTYEAGHLTAVYNGTVTVEADDLTYSGGTFAGIGVNRPDARLGSFQATMGAAPSFQVSPDVIGNYGSTTELTFTGGNTAWTAGTPGSPIFTVDHGTLSGQVVSSSTSATATYDPGDYLGTVIFTDPSTGLTDIAIVTSDPGTVPPTTTDPWMADDGVLATATTALFSPDYILTDQSPIIEATEEVPGRLAILDAIRQIWNAHFGEWTGSAPPSQNVFAQLLQVLVGASEATIVAYTSERNHSVMQELEATFDSLDAMRTTGQLTLADVIVTLQGTPSYTLANLHDQIAALPPGSNQDVLDALTAYFGANPPTIEQLGTMVSDLSTIAGYTLGDVLTAIAAIPAADLSAVSSKLDAIQPNAEDTLTTLAGEVSDVADLVLTVDLVVDQIKALLDAWPTPATGGAPVWPGAENATLGDSVELTSQLHLEEECHGVLVAITTPPTRTGLRQIGGALYDYGVGEIAFETDSGQIEPWQYLGFRTAIFTPKTMEKAAGARFRVLAGASGTVTPWLRS